MTKLSENYCLLIGHNIRSNVHVIYGNVECHTSWWVKCHCGLAAQVGNRRRMGCKGRTILTPVEHKSNIRDYGSYHFPPLPPPLKKNFRFLPLVNCRDRQWTDLQGGSGGVTFGGGLAGQRKTLHRKKFHFCIIQTILNKINNNKNLKQGLAQDYTQRIEGANISGLKLSRSPDFENFNYNNALSNYNNGLKA